MLAGERSRACGGARPEGGRAGGRAGAGGGDKRCAAKGTSDTGRGSSPRAGSEEGLSTAQQRHASALEPPTTPHLDVTAVPRAGRCAPDPRPLSHPSDPPCAAHLSAVRRLERLLPNRDV